jgi:hypothetical protein
MCGYDSSRVFCLPDVASEGSLVCAAAIALFHNIAQTKKGILLLLLCIMATLIESEDNMDDVYIPSFDMFLAAKPARMKLLLQPTSGKRNYCNCCSGK